MRRVLAIWLVLSWIGVGYAGAPVIRYADGRMSAAIDGMPLADVLTALSAETGASVRGDIAEPRDVTIHFEDLPIDRAIARLLGSENYTLRFGPSGELLVIYLRGQPAPPPERGKITFRTITASGPKWTLLAEEPGVEFVVGSVGRFWRKDYGGRPVAARALSAGRARSAD